MNTVLVLSSEDSSLLQLTRWLRSLEGGPLRTLELSLEAAAAGDFTTAAAADISPLTFTDASAELHALEDVLNVIAGRVGASAAAFEALRRDLGRALGDQSCLMELLAALQSLNAHCLTDLDTGLQAMADGDLTHAARPVTRPLRPAPGNTLGQVGEVFNEMLARSRTALRSYDAVREDLRVMLGDRSCLDDLRQGLHSLQRHCLRDLEEALEALVEGTALTRRIAPATSPISVQEAGAGELPAIFDRALARAQTAVRHLQTVRDRHITG